MYFGLITAFSHNSSPCASITSLTPAGLSLSPPPRSNLPWKRALGTSGVITRSRATYLSPLSPEFDLLTPEELSKAR